MVTVAIPTLNGGSLFEQVLAAIQSQVLPAGESLEVLVCDSGSSDGTPALARRLGAQVIEIDRSEFSHGATRNLLIERAAGDHVALLTQDAVPAGEDWLATLLSGFDLADDVGLVFGPYRPRPEASPMVARELSDWFASLAPTGAPRIDRLDPAERQLPARELLGRRSFFTDANGCIARSAWREVPFRAVAYAEDHVLALDMLRAGYAKVFLPTAAVTHSHDYSAWDWLRRSFDEARAIREVYGFAPSPAPRELALALRGRVGGDWRAAGVSGRRQAAGVLARSTVHHSLRAAGALLGARAGRLPAAVVRALSLEGRGP